MSDFTLTFSPCPDEGSPLQAALVPWDSELFGFPCWQLRCGEGSDALTAALRRFMEERESEGECLLVTKVPTRDVATGMVLGSCGFYVVETLLEIALPLVRLTSPARSGRGAALRQATVQDVDEIVSIAGSAFSVDRFHLDPTLSNAGADRRYRRWVEQGFHAGDPIFVFEDRKKGTLLGFCLIREMPAGVVDISLAAVHPILQGAGIGPLMYRAMLDECRRRGYQTAATRIAVNNLPVGNLFFQLGFEIRGAVMTYHSHHLPR
jgi:ribosomal protein S18 acetylase RimI-like enzyme